MPDKKVNLKDSLVKLNGIVDWFEKQEEVDVEAGLEKVREGAELVKICKKRLSEIQNEFEMIQRDVEKESPSNKGKIQTAKAVSTNDELINPDEIPF